MTLGFKMTESTHIYNAVVNSLKNAGINIVSPHSKKWNILWTGAIKYDILRETNKY